MTTLLQLAVTWMALTGEPSVAIAVEAPASDAVHAAVERSLKFLTGMSKLADEYGLARATTAAAAR
jgi:hypothetical protein